MCRYPAFMGHGLRDATSKRRKHLEKRQSLNSPWWGKKRRRWRGIWMPHKWDPFSKARKIRLKIKILHAGRVPRFVQVEQWDA